MSFFLISFFISLAIIILMIGRKLLLKKDEEENHHNEVFLSEILDFNKIKHSTIKISKKTGHTLIWIILRTYIISLNFINKKAKEIIKKIAARLNENKNNELQEKKEVSKYIKIISEYRQKIRRLKHRIKEEEGIE